MVYLLPRSLSDIDRSTAANDPRPSASFSARKNPQCIPANTPPVFPSLRPCTWPHLLRLVTKTMSDRLLEFSEAGCKLTNPDHMTAGDFVKVQLWVEGEEAFADIRLAEVSTVHKHWIAVEAIQVSPYDWMRLK